MVDEHERISQQHGPGQRKIDPIETAVLAPEREDNDDRESARHVARLGSERIGCIERKAEPKEKKGPFIKLLSTGRNESQIGVKWRCQYVHSNDSAIRGLPLT